MRTRRTATTHNHGRRVDTTQLLLVMIVFAVGFAFILGLAIAGTPEQKALALEEQRAVMPWRIASRVTGYIFGGVVLKVTLFVMGSFGAYYIMRIGVNWLDLRARQVHARNGLFPVIEMEKGVLYDPNRDNAGAHPIITLSALRVQERAATQADRIIIRQNEKALKQSDAPALEDSASAINLPEMVRLMDVVSHPALDTLALGMTEQGPLTASLHDLMHVLAVGASGFGKSAFLRALIWQLAQVKEPVQIVGIDCFGSELNAIADWDRLLFPIATDLPAAASTLKAITEEIIRRKGLYAEQPRAYDLQSYNRLVTNQLAPIVMLVDEGTAMLNDAGIADPLRQVVQTARQFGVYALLAGQNVNHRVMPTQIRDNFSTRLCFHTSQASRHVVLGETPEDVTVKGRAWIQRPGEMLRQIQCPFVTRDEVASVITRGKPARVIDLAVIKPEAQGENDVTVKRIKALHDEGASLNAIQRDVFGYTGGKAYNTVKAALG